MRVRRSILAAFLVLAAGAAVAQDAAPVPDRTLKIGTKVAPPFVIQGENGWEGISIELLAALARRMGVTYDLVETDIDGLIDGVADGTLDASIAAISVTEAREERVDFTHPYYRTGLGVAVAVEHRASFWAVLDALSSRDFLATIGLMTSLLFAVGGLAWLFERRRNSGQFDPKPVRGLLSGFWWAVVTMTTVGYGDKAPITFFGRLIGVVWMFSALILTALFTAQLSATLTSERISNRVSALADLARVRVGIVTDSASVGPLRALGSRPTGFPDVEAGLTALATDKIDAFVHDEAILIYLSDTVEGIEIAPLRFAPQDYAIVLPQGASYREAVNRGLLDVLSSNDWAEILRFYLGPSG